MVPIAGAAEIKTAADLAVGFTVAQPVIPARTFNLADFGAKGDGRTLNTQAFRRAIAAVDHAGGGRLVVPKGTFVTGPFQLCSALELHLEDGAVIQAPATFAELGLPDPATFKSQRELDAGFAVPDPLISGRNLHDVALTGRGVIDGSGAHWWAWSERAARNAPQPGRLVIPRPHLVVIKGCARLLVADLTFRNSSKFHLVPTDITDLTIESVKVRAPFDAPNTDAIDPGPVTNAVIRHCDIDTGDDDIVIKTGGTNILIEDCVIAHGHGISIGSGTTGGVSRMLVRRCRLDGTDNGLRIKSMRGAGGPVRDIRYEDIAMEGVGHAILLDLNYVDNNRPDFRGDPRKVPSIDGVVFERVAIHGAEHAGRIVGLPDSPITGVVLREVSIHAGDDLRVANATPPAEASVTRDLNPANVRPRPKYRE
ncbi:MAG TPA: glycoside hydrolase family 28 protein [Opitutaceae bacterium]|nr:glycoside hydrolase family 28 protein [Opitutaceae bacterium]